MGGRLELYGALTVSDMSVGWAGRLVQGDRPSMGHGRAAATAAPCCSPELPLP